MSKFTTDSITDASDSGQELTRLLGIITSSAESAGSGRLGALDVYASGKRIAAAADRVCELERGRANSEYMSVSVNTPEFPTSFGDAISPNPRRKEWDIPATLLAEKQAVDAKIKAYKSAHPEAARVPPLDPSRYAVFKVSPNLG